MEKTKQMASRLDVLLRILEVACLVGAVGTLVGLVLVGAFFLFHLDPEQIGTGYQMLQLGALELELAGNAAPEAGRVLMVTAANLAMAFGLCLLYRAFIKCVRQLLAPMKEGMPFQSAASDSLRKLSVFTIILGFASNMMDGINLALTIYCYDLTEILISDRISHVTVMHEFDLSFLIVGALLMLLSYIFRYGEQLQQLSDETL